MNCQGVVDSLIARLGAAFTDPKVAVKPWPNDPKSKPEVLGGIGEIWVTYDGSKFKDPAGVDGVTQDREPRFAIALFVRKLNGNQGAASFVDAIYEVVHGYQPDTGRPLLCVGDSYVGFDNGVWQYSVIVRTSAPQIPVETPTGLGNAVLGPALKLVTLDDAVGGDSEVVFPEE